MTPLFILINIYCVLRELRTNEYEQYERGENDRISYINRCGSVASDV
jgi:hypothetical protein